MLVDKAIVAPAPHSRLHLSNQDNRTRFIVRYHALQLHFFFKAEDGIRDDLVTAVQTCALPIISYAVFCLKKKTNYEGMSGLNSAASHSRAEAHKMTFADNAARARVFASQAREITIACAEHWTT